jgi:hypothetical protein
LTAAAIHSTLTCPPLGRHFEGRTVNGNHLRTVNNLRLKPAGTARRNRTALVPARSARHLTGARVLRGILAIC